MKKHTITSDERAYPLGVFPMIEEYATGQLGLRIKAELETPYGWREVTDGEPHWKEGMRWRISFFHYEPFLIPGGLTPVGIVW